MATLLSDPAEAHTRETDVEQAKMAVWLRRIRTEYLELPALSLTRQQVKRLCGLDEATCDRVLAALVEARLLRLTPTGSYIRVE